MRAASARATEPLYSTPHCTPACCCFSGATSSNTAGITRRKQLQVFSSAAARTRRASAVSSAVGSSKMVQHKFADTLGGGPPSSVSVGGWVITVQWCFGAATASHEACVLHRGICCKLTAHMCLGQSEAEDMTLFCHCCCRQAEMSEHEYHRLADETLDHLQEKLEVCLGKCQPVHHSASARLLTVHHTCALTTQQHCTVCYACNHCCSSSSSSSSSRLCPDMQAVD
jgi:hypothetical protein